MSSNSNNYYYINIEKFNTIWQQKNMETYKSEYNRLGDIFKHEIDTIIKNTIIKIPLYLINPVTSPYKNINDKEEEEIPDKFDMKQCINDILFLYIKCKCYDISNYATIWNECLQNYLIAKIIFERTEIWIKLNNRNIVSIKQNRTNEPAELINIIDNRKIDTINKVFTGYNKDNIYLFIQNLVEHLGLLNNNIILDYFTKFINIYNKKNKDKNLFLLDSLSSIVRNNFEEENYGEGILVEETIGEGGKRKHKSRITRKSYRTRKSRKSRKYKTRKSKKTV